MELQEPFPEDEKLKPFVRITKEHHNQGITIENEEENNLVEGIEMEWHAAVKDNLSKVSIVYRRMVQGAINKEQILFKAKDILQEELQFDNMILPDENARYWDENAHQECSQTWKRGEI